jgi:DNA mismatch endonuclease (patch repair protein)
MADTLTREQRSQRMALVRGRDTKPELVVRSIAHRLGYRFRLHRRDLPGTPDLVFPRLHRVVFVHGCFWHRHARCSLARLPKSRHEFWTPKLEGNRERDAKKIAALRRAGWKTLVVWECQLRDQGRVQRALARFLGKGER